MNLDTWAIHYWTRSKSLCQSLPCGHYWNYASICAIIYCYPVTFKMTMKLLFQNLEQRIASKIHYSHICRSTYQLSNDGLNSVVCAIVVTLATFDSMFPNNHISYLPLREDINEKKRFLSGIARMRGGDLPMPEFFGPFSRSAFLVNKKSLFLQKCQCIELLTVF